ncbi:MAG: molybdopterin-synthase adenylyltransferase [Chloroflexota bacterium]|nr:molybdopterin-synthase adenylyltransferase [Chloroflexota bacterium]
MTEDPLGEEELVRYSRQIVLREVGGAGQLRLRSAAVAVVGAGGLGSPAVLYLAAAGVGRITVIDDDRVALDNLQRQVLHDTASLGETKVESARRRVAALNPAVRVDTLERRLDADGAAALLAGHDLALDGSDNFPTKFAVNDACVRLGICAVIGGVVRFDGQVVVVPPGAPCYRCLFGDEPPAGLVPGCRAAGVLGAVAGMVGCLQAAEALRYLLGAGDEQGGRVLVLDALRPRLRAVAFPRDPGCRACASAAPAAVR